MKWITRERPKIDRIACPWLIARFIDDGPEFLYVPGDAVLEGRRGNRRHALRRARRGTWAPRRLVQLRRLHRQVPTSTMPRCTSLR